MDFGTCFVVVLVAILYLLAWIDQQSNKKLRIGIARGCLYGQPLVFSVIGLVDISMYIVIRNASMILVLSIGFLLGAG